MVAKPEAGFRKNSVRINSQLSRGANEVTEYDQVTGCSRKANIEMKAFIFKPTNLNGTIPISPISILVIGQNNFHL